MDLPSSVSVLLQGFDAWVLEAKPSCEVATRVLRSLQHAMAQTRGVREPLASIPVLAREERFGRLVPGQFHVPPLVMEPLPF